MKYFYAFTKKEFLESWRTKRILLLACIFVLFGVMNPLVAKITPELLRSTLGEQAAAAFPDPTSLDSWQQFYKNINQLGIYLLAILFSGCLSGEVKAGQLVPLVTKGLPRPVILISKFTVMLVLWLSCNLLSFGITAAYTAYYFPDNLSPNIWQALLPLLFFGLFLLSLILLSSALARSNYESLFITIGGMVVLYLLSLWPKSADFSPLSLINENLAILQRQSSLTDLKWNFLVTLGCSLIFFYGAIRVFNQKKL